MTSQRATLKAFTDAAAEAVARAIATVRREAQHDRELREAEHRARIAELDARLGSVAALELQVQERLSSVKDGDPGKDADPAQIEALIDDRLRSAIEALPAPAKGDIGPPGRLPVVEVWTDKVHYEGQVRTHAGSTYQAVRDTAKEPPHEDWHCIAQGGSTGASMRVCGTYQPDAIYRHLDVVAMDGGSFVAKTDDPGPCPGEGWQLVASRGKAGKPAERAAPIQADNAAVALAVDDSGVLTLTNGDGSIVTCDLYPLLERLSR